MANDILRAYTDPNYKLPFAKHNPSIKHSKRSTKQNRRFTAPPSVYSDSSDLPSIFEEVSLPPTPAAQRHDALMSGDGRPVRPRANGARTLFGVSNTRRRTAAGSPRGVLPIPGTPKGSTHLDRSLATATVKAPSPLRQQPSAYFSAESEATESEISHSGQTAQPSPGVQETIATPRTAVHEIASNAATSPTQETASHAPTSAVPPLVEHAKSPVSQQPDTEHDHISEAALSRPSSNSSSRSPPSSALTSAMTADTEQVRIALLSFLEPSPQTPAGRRAYIEEIPEEEELASQAHPSVDGDALLTPRANQSTSRAKAKSIMPRSPHSMISATETAASRISKRSSAPLQSLNKSPRIRQGFGSPHLRPPSERTVRSNMPFTNLNIMPEGGSGDTVFKLLRFPVVSQRVPALPSIIMCSATRTAILTLRREAKLTQNLPKRTEKLLMASAGKMSNYMIGVCNTLLTTEEMLKTWQMIGDVSIQFIKEVMAAVASRTFEQKRDAFVNCIYGQRGIAEMRTYVREQMIKCCGFFRRCHQELRKAKYLVEVKANFATESLKSLYVLEQTLLMLKTYFGDLISEVDQMVNAMANRIPFVESAEPEPFLAEARGQWTSWRNKLEVYPLEEVRRLLEFLQADGKGKLRKRWYQCF